MGLVDRENPGGFSTMLRAFKELSWSHRFSLRLKFIIAISLCLAITMITSMRYLDHVQAKAFEQEARHRSEIVAQFGEANLAYVGKHLRPAVEAYTKEFVLEAMSAPYSTRVIFEYFNKTFPQYLYRQPALNPLNPINQATEFDRQIIQRFQNDRTLKEITGYRQLNQQETFYVAKPTRVEASCLRCHGLPEVAPAKQVEKYGTQSGYGWKVGDIISTLMIDIPTQDLRSDQIALRKTVLATFIALGIILISLIYWFFDRLVNQRLRKMIHVMAQVAENPSLTMRLPDRPHDEIGVLARTFNRMANSLDLTYADLEQKVAERTTEVEQTLHQLQTTQAQMIQAEKMASMGQLVAGIAHEINNPVSFIHGNLMHVETYTQDLLSMIQLYQRYYPDPAPELQSKAENADLKFIQDDLPNILASMQVGTQRIQEIVLSLRNFSRLDESDMKQVNLHEGIDSTLLILQHRLKATHQQPEIQVVKEYNDLPAIDCYPGLLNQVFMNILANAIDAVESQQELEAEQNRSIVPGQITICTAVLDDPWVQITIADNGCGIPLELQQRIFDPFFTTKPVGKGTGMGMSLSYQIITEKHQGRLWCESEPGMGSKFGIEIPSKKSSR
jgi:signal transduction histidine kinase